MRSNHLVSVVGVVVLGIASIVAQPASANCHGAYVVCPRPPRGCVFDRVDNERKACRILYRQTVYDPTLRRTRLVDTCYPSAQCRYKSAPGAEGRCGTTLLYTACAAP